MSKELPPNTPFAVKFDLLFTLIDYTPYKRKIMKQKILYVRVSSLEQRTDRQRVKEQDYDLVFEDKCSGSIPLFEREQGLRLKKIVESNVRMELSVWSIDRLGRDMRDILNSIHFFSENKICIHFISQGLKTLDDNGEENAISKMIISILGIISEMERKQIKERTREGIELAKMKGVYKGRNKGAKENIATFLNKPKNKRALELLHKGYKGTEVAKIVGLHINTITKIRKSTSSF